jgi:multidrug efflux system membrane fusion protein
VEESPAEAPRAPTELVPPRTSWPLRIGLALFVIAIIGGIAGLRMRNARGGGGPGGRGPGGDAAPAPVRTMHPELHDVPIHLEGLGTVTPIETSVVRARVSGQLTRVLFTEGQEVHAGDVLAEIDPRPFRVALAQAQAVLARDQASLESARQVRDRGRQLHEHELLSTADLQTQEGAAAAAEATVQADRASVDAARLNLEWTHVVAPIDGRTGLRQIDPGNLVSSGDANGIVVITRVDPIAVVFTLPQDEIGPVLERMATETLDVEVLSRDGTRALATGHLTVIDNRVDPTTGTVRMKAQVENGTRALWPSQLVETRMLLETRRGVMVVPDASVQQGPDGSFVYVVVDHHAQVRPVTIDRIVDDLAIVASGLALTDEIVSEGQSRLRPNAEVRLETDPPPDAGARP